ncbi:mucin-2-like [Sycon ciliatum]|uniref:mucin-2-like n=1 Tax=Sycon ciliatum TaxID=27933 RepID=UPI0031F607A4
MAVVLRCCLAALMLFVAGQCDARSLPTEQESGKEQRSLQCNGGTYYYHPTALGMTYAETVCEQDFGGRVMSANVVDLACGANLLRMPALQASNVSGIPVFLQNSKSSPLFVIGFCHVWDFKRMTFNNLWCSDTLPVICVKDASLPSTGGASSANAASNRSSESTNPIGNSMQPSLPPDIVALPPVNVNVHDNTTTSPGSNFGSGNTTSTAPSVSDYVMPSVPSVVDDVMSPVPSVVDDVMPPAPSTFDVMPTVPNMFDMPSAPSVADNTMLSVPRMVDDVMPMVPNMFDILPSEPSAVPYVMPSVPNVVDDVIPAVPRMVDDVMPSVPHMSDDVIPAVPRMVDDVMPAVSRMVNDVMFRAPDGGDGVTTTSPRGPTDAVPKLPDVMPSVPRMVDDVMFRAEDGGDGITTTSPPATTDTVPKLSDDVMPPVPRILDDVMLRAEDGGDGITTTSPPATTDAVPKLSNDVMPPVPRILDDVMFRAEDGGDGITATSLPATTDAVPKLSDDVMPPVPSILNDVMFRAEDGGDGITTTSPPATTDAVPKLSDDVMSPVPRKLDDVMFRADDGGDGITATSLPATTDAVPKLSDDVMPPVPRILDVMFRAEDGGDGITATSPREPTDAVPKLTDGADGFIGTGISDTIAGPSTSRVVKHDVTTHSADIVQSSPANRSEHSLAGAPSEKADPSTDSVTFDTQATSSRDATESIGPAAASAASTPQSGYNLAIVLASMCGILLCVIFLLAWQVKNIRKPTVPWKMHKYKTQRNCSSCKNSISDSGSCSSTASGGAPEELHQHYYYNPNRSGGTSLHRSPSSTSTRTFASLAPLRSYTNSLDASSTGSGEGNAPRTRTTPLPSSEGACPPAGRSLTSPETASPPSGGAFPPAAERALPPAGRLLTSPETASPPPIPLTARSSPPPPPTPTPARSSPPPKKSWSPKSVFAKSWSVVARSATPSERSSSPSPPSQPARSTLSRACSLPEKASSSSPPTRPRLPLKDARQLMASPRLFNSLSLGGGLKTSPLSQQAATSLILPLDEMCSAQEGGFEVDDHESPPGSTVAKPTRYIETSAAVGSESGPPGSCLGMKYSNMDLPSAGLVGVFPSRSDVFPENSDRE